MMSTNKPTKLTASAELIIDAHNLTKTYDQKQVVKGISFNVRKGEIFGILGPNGAGKTTTLEMLEAFRSLDSGQVLIDGIDLAAEPHRIKRMIGIQLQTSSFFDKLRLTEHLQVFADIYGVDIEPLSLLEKVQLTDKANSYVEHLSGGQRQRFAIATALVNSPCILFLDEPTTGLDPQSRRNLWDLILQIRSEGMTILLTTHYMDEAEKLCDRIAIMDQGEIIALDTPNRLVKSLLKRGFTKDQVVEQANLEDVFIDLTGRDLRE